MSDVVIRLPAFSANGETLSGTLPLATLPRLCRQLPAAPAGAVTYHLAGSCDANGCLFLAVEWSAQLPLQCRRCLEVFAHPLTVRQRFWIAGSTPPAEDAEAGEELEAGEFPLEEFLTDEMLLSLPLAPVHAPSACKVVAQ